MGVEGGSAARLERLASSQHGVVTRAQLLDLGVGRRAIERRLGRDLLPVHRGVYRVGHRAPSVEASYMAAVLAAGDGAAMSGRAAGYLERLVRGRAPRAEVTTTAHRLVPGVTVHRVRSLDPRETTLVRGIPVTSVPRTLVDLAPVLDDDDLARACHDADVLHGTTPQLIEQVLERRPNAPGANRLRRILTGDSPVLLSQLERLFLAAVRHAHLPVPQTNRPAGASRVDCRWPEQRLTVELDSYRFHRTRHAWEQDREREREARARGDRHRRYTWTDVTAEPGPMLAELRRLLA
jgi:hypothetical protein